MPAGLPAACQVSCRCGSTTRAHTWSLSKGRVDRPAYAPAQNVGFAGGYCLGMGRARVAGGPIAANQVAYVDESGLLPVGQQLRNTFGALHVQAYVLLQGGGPYWTNSVILR